jgi:hypothetical protein
MRSAVYSCCVLVWSEGIVSDCDRTQSLSVIALFSFCMHNCHDHSDGILMGCGLDDPG